MKRIPFLRDVQFEQTLDYPTVEVDDRPREGGALRRHGRGRGPCAWSWRRRRPGSPSLNYWVDVKTGFDYLVQIQVPPLRMEKPEDVETLPVESVNPLVNLMIRDVATVRQGRAARRDRPRHVAALPDPDRERRGRGHGPGLAPGRARRSTPPASRPAACGSRPWASSRR